MLELENGYESILQASHVSKNDGNGCVLKDVCVSFSPKGIHGILGPKKSGKSTLMDLLAFCEEADEGKILLRGYPIDQKINHGNRRSVTSLRSLIFMKK